MRTAALVLADLTVLMVVATMWAVRKDLDATSGSATPVTDGASVAVLVAAALVLLNGLLLVMSPRTRHLGAGMLVAVVGAIPVGLVVWVVGLTTFTR
ncbi:hypothetical protein GCM10009623_01610 [Nocardioides aestuarii]|uniref:Histidine kinase n=1 Tax=Nocardioides aestuarii TaxID=252231 RepID=A0ABW4TJL2_9ACTN